MKRCRVDSPVLLLLCPFDGGPPILELEIDDEFAEPKEVGPVDAYVWCHECGAQGPRCNTYAFDESESERIALEAAEAWNKAPRPSETATKENHAP